MSNLGWGISLYALMPEIRSYQLQKISEVEARLHTEMEARQTLYKNYKRAVNGLDGAGNALSAITVDSAVSGVAILSTVVLTPVRIALEGLAAVCGTATFAGRVVSRRLDKKAEKHDRIQTSAETVLRTISLITSRVSTSSFWAKQSASLR